MQINLQAVPTKAVLETIRLLCSSHVGLDALEILYSPNMQIESCIFVYNEYCARVHLQTGERSHVADTPLNTPLKGKGLVGTGGNHDHFSSLWMKPMGLLSVYEIVFLDNRAETWHE